MKTRLFFSGIMGIVAVLLVSGCANFADGVAAVSGKGGTIARHDAYDSTKALADKLKNDQPPTEWETIFPYENTDFIEFMGKNRVLIGTVEVGSMLGIPKHREIVLYHAGTGKPMWKTERKAFTRGNYTVLATQPLILITGSDKDNLDFFALDPSSGQLKWEQTFKMPATFTLPEDSDRICILFSEGSGRRIQSVDAGTGNVLWTGDLPGEFFEKDKEAPLISDSSDIFVNGSKLVKMSGKDGKRLWVVEDKSLKNKETEVVNLNEGILLWEKDQTILLDKKTGKQKWKNQVKNGGIKFMAYQGGNIFRVVGTKAGSNDRIQSLHPRTGKFRWNKKSGGIIVSPIAIEKGMLFFTTDENFIGLRVSNGKRRFKTALPKSFEAGSPSKAEFVGQPDMFHFESGKIYISREMSGVAAYSRINGKQLWFQENFQLGNDPYSADSRYQMMLASMIIHGYGGESKPPSTGANSYTSGSPNSSLNAQQRSLDSMKQRADGVLANKNATRLERKSAHGSKILASGLDIANTRTQMAVEQLQTAQNIVNAAVGLNIAIAKGLKDDAVKGLISRSMMELKSAHYMRNRRFQGDYYVRPFLDEGRGVTIVDLKTGKRNDLLFSPAMQVLLQFGIDMQNFSIDPEGKQLLIVGVGLDTEKYEEYVKWKWRMPKPSLLAYNLSTLKFDKENILKKRQVENIAKQLGPKDLSAWASSGQIEIVENLLTRGVDVNCKSPYDGGTALISATIMAQLEMVRILLEAGADVNIKNNYGKAALFYSNNKATHKSAGKTSETDIKKYKEIEKMLRKAGAK